MCKHIRNPQVSIRAPCCKKWFDCADCHNELMNHSILKQNEMHFICKKCKKGFRKNMEEFDECDEYCPHCDNQYVVIAQTPQMAVGIECYDARMGGNILIDDRLRLKKKDVELP